MRLSLLTTLVLAGCLADPAPADDTGTLADTGLTADTGVATDTGDTDTGDTDTDVGCPTAEFDTHTFDNACFGA